MQVFLSWSGDKSKRIATQLKDWLPNIFHGVEFWMSSHDLTAGTPWSGELHHKIRTSNMGVLLLTQQNQLAPWLLYECGCLIMTVEPGCVIPILIDFQPSQLEYPIALLQSLQYDSEGIQQLVSLINKTQATPIVESRLSTIIHKWLPDIFSSFRSKFNTCQIGEVYIAKPTMNKILDEQLIQMLKDEFYPMVENHGKVILDLSDVHHISSSGIGILIFSNRIAIKNQTKFAIIGNDTVDEILQVTKLNMIIQSYESLQQALDSYQD